MMTGRVTIHKSRNIARVLKHNDEDAVWFLDCDERLVKLNQSNNKYIAASAWFSIRMTLARERFKDVHTAPFLVLKINYALQQIISLKHAEKKTLNVVN